jgi:hypothetical protein
MASERGGWSLVCKWRPGGGQATHRVGCGMRGSRHVVDSERQSGEHGDISLKCADSLHLVEKPWKCRYAPAVLLALVGGSRAGQLGRYPSVGNTLASLCFDSV